MTFLTCQIYPPKRWYGQISLHQTSCLLKVVLASIPLYNTKPQSFPLNNAITNNHYCQSHNHQNKIYSLANQATNWKIETRNFERINNISIHLTALADIITSYEQIVFSLHFNLAPFSFFIIV